MRRYLGTCLWVLLLLLNGEASSAKKKARGRGTKKNQPPEGLPGGPGGRGPPGMGEPYVDPKTVPDPGKKTFLFSGATLWLYSSLPHSPRWGAGCIACQNRTRLRSSSTSR
jgi:hypothetical protein